MRQLSDDEAEYRRRCARVDKALGKFEPTPKRPPKQRWFDSPPTDENAAKMSPELRAVLRRNWHILGGTKREP